MFTYLQLHLDSPPHTSPFDRRIARAGHAAALRSYLTQRPTFATPTIVDVADVYGGEIHANAHKRGYCDLCQASFTDYCDVRQFFRFTLKRTSDLSHGLIEIMRCCSQPSSVPSHRQHVHSAAHSSVAAHPATFAELDASIVRQKDIIAERAAVCTFAG